MNMLKTGLSLLLMAVITPSFAAEKAELPAQATAKVNAQFEVKLPSNPTTGYNWIVLKLPEQVALTGMDYAQSPDCAAGMVGCGGTTTLRFKALKAGTGKLIVQYARPWETLTNEAETINIHVTP
ncbi:TPA: protease inhibitor I42 family protein [Raoultella ornithinolytica]|nr:protease inhibitor I42 family protein [Raoultella ornithinolytica]HAT1670162.1 protease inhibitor I42 family protein [Raoultella ornithinolytica]